MSLRAGGLRRSGAMMTGAGDADLMAQIEGLQPEGHMLTDAVLVIESFDPTAGESYMTIVRHPAGLWWKHRGMVHGAGVDMDDVWREKA